MRKQVVAILCAGAAMMLWSGCGSTVTGPKNATRVTVTISSIGQVLIGGSAADVQGTIMGDSDITSITAKVFDGSGNDKSADFTVYFSTGYLNLDSADLMSNMGMTIKALASAAAGTYTLQLTAHAGSYVMNTGEKSFTVLTPVFEKTNIALGAQNASDPSLLDADNMTPYSSTITDPAQQASIDAIFVYSTVVNPPELSFTSPSVAQGAPYSNWASTSKAATLFEDVTATANYFDITTQEQINALWTVNAGVTRLTLYQGQLIVIYTSEGAYKLVQITTLTGTDGYATMNIKGLY